MLFACCCWKTIGQDVGQARPQAEELRVQEVRSVNKQKERYGRPAEDIQEYGDVAAKWSIFDDIRLAKMKARRMAARGPCNMDSAVVGNAG